MTAPDLARLVGAVSSHTPRRLEVETWHAATALVLHEDGGGPELLFIERAHREGDRWSGDMAFPGGKREVSDDDLVATAVRETAEEVGVELDTPVGRLDDVTGRVNKGVVSPFVFTVGARPELRPEPGEVAHALWIPLRDLLDPVAAFPFRWPEAPDAYPALRYRRHVIWGLTFRTLELLVELVGHALPRPAGVEVAH